MMFVRIAALALLLALCSVASAQYPVSLPTKTEDSLKTDSVATDTTTLAAPKPSEFEQMSELKANALKWVRRLVYRGFIDDQLTGTSATYALTEWKEASGPAGPVLAYVTVVYLGAVSWLGQPSTWIQATYKSLDVDRPSVDFDLVLAGRENLGEAYRALWRVNKEELKSFSFGVRPGEFDYDREDKPTPGKELTLKLYAGDFSVTEYRGSGADGEKVVAYRADEVPPLSLVRLGYGNMSLNLRDRATDVEPRLQVPLPTSR
jgi:hypothetical protein